MLYDRTERAVPYMEATSAKRPRGRPRGQCNELGVNGDGPAVSGKRRRVQVEPSAVGSPSGFRDQRKAAKDCKARARERSTRGGYGDSQTHR